MAQNEKTSEELASLAARILGGAEYTESDVRRLAASVLTQTADRKIVERKSDGG